jgi:hypothetical protein
MFDSINAPDEITDASPWDINANTSLFNLNPAYIKVVAKTVTPENPVAGTPTTSTSPAATTTTSAPAKIESITDTAAATAAKKPASHSPNSASPLEMLYNFTDGGGRFDKVVNFLGSMAEAESNKGKKIYNEHSSANGIFHFLVGNGGGHNKEGKKEKLGQYDENGILRRSSFETAKNRLKVMITRDPEVNKAVNSNPTLLHEINTVMNAKTPDTLSPQNQAILAYAHLKMGSKDFDEYLEGKKDSAYVYGKNWVTFKDGKSFDAIKKNWSRAKNRSGDLFDNLNFFGIAGPTENKNYGESIPRYSLGGTLKNLPSRDNSTVEMRIIQKSRLI